MFGMGMPEIILILAIALIVIGPKKLPDLAKSMGRAMREFKKATSELKESLEIDTELGDVKKASKDLNRDVKDPVDLADSHRPGPSADGPPGASPAGSQAKDSAASSPGEPAGSGGPTPTEGPKKDG